MIKSNNPYKVILKRYTTEKSVVLQQLKNATSNRSVSRCENPKYVFIVNPLATKKQIANALEEIYAEANIKVVAVNTINVKSKPTRKRRGKVGRKSSFKKAIVTLDKNDSLDEL
ncbi:MAG: 50S ribosomal protein L23 [Chlamydiales bacterium]